MSFQEAIQSGFQNYAKFEGRSSRSAFWYWELFAFLVAIVASVLDAIVGGGSILQLLSSLGLLVPGLAVGARRLHDINKSGWFLLLYFVIILGWIYLIYLWVQPSDEGSNS